MLEGMVHALHDIHRVLKPGGILLDLRPAIGDRIVEVDLVSATLYAGMIDASATTADKQAADNAIAQAVEDGWYALEHQEIFEMITDMDTADDLRDYGGSFRRSVLAEEIIETVESLTADEPEDSYTVRIRRNMHIARYRKIAKS